MNISFPNNIGYQLAAILNLPEGEGPFPVVIFSHGLDSSKDSPRTVPIAKTLLKRGVASFRFDYTGHGDSEGLREDSTINRQLSDLESAISKVGEIRDLDNNKIAIHGSSSGALVAILEAGKNNFSALFLRAPRVNGFYSEASDNIDKIKTPIFIIQGDNDPLLPETKTFMDKLAAPKKLAIIKDGDHLFTNPIAFEKVKLITITWLSEALLS